MIFSKLGTVFNEEKFEFTPKAQSNTLSIADCNEESLEKQDEISKIAVTPSNKKEEN